MTKYLKYLTILALALVTGCASQFSSDVSRFHRLPKPNGETFVIEPMDKAKTGSLEFSQYANMLGDRLVGVGYRAVAPGQKPDLIVTMDYGVNNGQVRIESSPNAYPYGWGRWGWGYPYGYDPFDPWGYGLWGYQPDIRSVVYYNRFLLMNIDKPSATPGQAPERLFEGRVESEGQNNQMTEVMPYLVQAMFANFPGPSGVTQHIVIDKQGHNNY